MLSGRLPVNYSNLGTDRKGKRGVQIGPHSREDIASTSTAFTMEGGLNVLWTLWGSEILWRILIRLAYLDSLGRCLHSPLHVEGPHQSHPCRHCDHSETHHSTEPRSKGTPGHSVCDVTRMLSFNNATSQKCHRSRALYWALQPTPLFTHSYTSPNHLKSLLGFAIRNAFIYREGH